MLSRFSLNGILHRDGKLLLHFVASSVVLLRDFLDGLLNLGKLLFTKAFCELIVSESRLSHPRLVSLQWLGQPICFRSVTEVWRIREHTAVVGRLHCILLSK